MNTKNEITDYLYLRDSLLFTGNLLDLNEIADYINARIKKALMNLDLDLSVNDFRNCFINLEYQCNREEEVNETSPELIKALKIVNSTMASIMKELDEGSTSNYIELGYQYQHRFSLEKTVGQLKFVITNVESAPIDIALKTPFDLTIYNADDEYFEFGLIPLKVSSLTRLKSVEKFALQYEDALMTIIASCE